MNLIKKNKPVTLLSYLTLLTLSLIIILFHKKDIDLSNSWLIFYLWLINFYLAILFIAIKIPKNVYNKLISIIAEDRKIIFLIFLITLFTRFFLLSVYPYVVLGDALRDAGLNGLKINQGSLKDFFDFGAYQGYGNFIPLISYFFIPLFKNSPLIYLIPSTMVGDIIRFSNLSIGPNLGRKKGSDHRLSFFSCLPLSFTLQPYRTFSHNGQLALSIDNSFYLFCFNFFSRLLSCWTYLWFRLSFLCWNTRGSFYLGFLLVLNKIYPPHFLPY